MKEYTFVIFKQLRKECPMNDDPVIGYVHGVHADAQRACNELHSHTVDYHYYMELDELKAGGFQVYGRSTNMKEMIDRWLNDLAETGFGYDKPSDFDNEAELNAAMSAEVAFESKRRYIIKESGNNGRIERIL